PRAALRLAPATCLVEQACGLLGAGSNTRPCFPLRGWFHWDLFELGTSMNRWWPGMLAIALILTPSLLSAADQGTPEMRTEARLVRLQKPAYPTEAQRQGIEGRVIVWISVSAEGDVLDAKVHRSSGYTLLDDHTLRYAKKLEFVPARRGQTPIPTTVLLPVNYR